MPYWNIAALCYPRMLRETFVASIWLTGLGYECQWKRAPGSLLTCSCIVVRIVCLARSSFLPQELSTTWTARSLGRRRLWEDYPSLQE